MAQGFVKANNLAESDNGARDRGILDNLGGVGITDDILLFQDNLNARSTLVPDDYEFNVDGQGNVEFVVTGDGRVAFSQGTKLAYGTNSFDYIYYVSSSNGKDRFQLSEIEGNARFNPTVKEDISRSDAITQSDLFNLDTPRIETRNVVAQDQTGEVGADPNGGGGLDVSTGSLFDEFTINEQKDYITARLSVFDFKKGRVVRTDFDNNLDNDLTFSGNIVITNRDNDPVSPPETYPLAPGLYIASGDSATRAFTDASNPWTEQGTAGSGAITADTGGLANDAQAQSLVLNPTDITQNPPVPNGEPALVYSGANGVIAETNALLSFTHKYPVLINGEQYYFLLKV